MTFEELQNELFTRAHEDENFKNKLMSSPMEAIESVSGTNLKNQDKIKFVVADQSQHNTVYLNIPPNPLTSGQELSNSQLEAIVGGGFFRDLGHFAGSQYRRYWDWVQNY